MRIGVYASRIPPERAIEGLAEDARRAREGGFASYWLPQWTSMDALTAFAAIAHSVPGIELGTAVVPIAGRHPLGLAMQALTTQAATGGRLQLGIGLSHRPVVEDQMGLSYAHPAQRMKEFLAALDALLRTGEADVDGVLVRCRTSIQRVATTPPPVLLAALGPRMLDLAGRAAAGSLLWLTGARTIRDFVAPRLHEAARGSGRPMPRIVAALPICVTDDVPVARAHLRKIYAGVGTFSSYRRVLDRESAAGPEDVAILGDESRAAAALDELEDAGVTEFVAMEIAPVSGDSTRTRRFLEARAGT